MKPAVQSTNIEIYWKTSLFFFFFGYGKPSTYWCLLSGACQVKCFQIYKIFQEIVNYSLVYLLLLFIFLVIYYQFLQFFF
jgi:hypothetical protein